MESKTTTKDLRLILRNDNKDKTVYSVISWSKEEMPTKQEYDDIVKFVCAGNCENPENYIIWSAQLFPQL